jgi:hypothetical protein
LAGRTPHEAVNEFVRPLQRAVSFVTRDILVASGYRPADEPHVLTFPGGDPVRLSGDRRLGFLLIHRYTIQRAEQRRGPWKVHSSEYSYELLDEDERRILAYLWHPYGRSPVTWPHLHIPKTLTFDLSRAHPPTGRVSVESVLRFAIQDLGVRALRGNWRAAMEKGEQAFLARRTWG